MAGLPSLPRLRPGVEVGEDIVAEKSEEQTDSRGFIFLLLAAKLYRVKQRFYHHHPIRYSISPALCFKLIFLIGQNTFAIIFSFVRTEERVFIIPGPSSQIWSIGLTLTPEFRFCVATHMKTLIVAGKFTELV